jgi:hypothetical protein
MGTFLTFLSPIHPNAYMWVVYVVPVIGACEVLHCFNPLAKNLIDICQELEIGSGINAFTCQICIKMLLKSRIIHAH